MPIDQSPPASFGDLLKRYRVAAGLTQEMLAERARLSRRGISDLERGVSDLPRLTTMALLIPALDLSPQDRAILEAAARGADRSPSPRFRLGGLPLLSAELIGRVRECDALRALLARPEVRLVTVTGPPGVGKTSLAVRVAADNRDLFPDGVAFVGLAAVEDVALVPAAIGEALGLPGGDDASLVERAAASLGDARLLLLLDNFEHVAPAADLLGDLVAACPRITLLVTSRTMVRVRGAHDLPVPPLATPDPSHLPTVEILARVPSVDLFVRRAQAIKPDYRLTPGNARAIADICIRLDGLPLAIELAAAAVTLLPPSALLAQMERRLPLLTHGAYDSPARQRTMRDAIAWSYDLLSADEQALFRRLAVFCGGCTLEAAQTVGAPPGTPGPYAPRPLDWPSLHASDTLGELVSLVAKNLVRQQEDPDGEARLDMLEILREYGRERLLESGEEAAARRAHAAYYRELADTARAAWHGPDGAAWRERLEREYDNLRAALNWATEARDTDLGRGLAAALEALRGAPGHADAARPCRGRVDARGENN